MLKTSSPRDLGDFQTPQELVNMVLKCLGRIGRHWGRVLEPTCGSGNFLRGLLTLDEPPAEIQAIELQDRHLEAAREIGQHSTSVRVELIKANLFNLDLQRDLHWTTGGPLLVVGNPPWVTNSELGSLGSMNVPRKSNIKAQRGIEAMTGDSNFDIAEYIWLKLIRELANEQPTIALLCKTSVARNVLKFCSDANYPVRRAFLRKIDAKQWFGATVDACLFCLEIGGTETRYEAEVYQDTVVPQCESVMGIIRGRIVADVSAYEETAFADGSCTLTWRQGIKHDAASVMELTEFEGRYQNALGERVDIESEYIYPLAKSSHLFHQSKFKPQSFVLVTQHELGAETSQLRWTAPQLWHYLSEHSEVFTRRRSSIYRGQPPFALFGIGTYSFAPYKVAISGFYKAPRFRIIAPLDGRPVMLDDTCYFVPCWTIEQAAFLHSLLTNSLCLKFLSSIIFTDSKRPITKRLLQRIDLRAILERVDREALESSAKLESERLGFQSAAANPLSRLQLEEVLFGNLATQRNATKSLFE